MRSILTIFVGSFLLFLIQPLVGNTLLPAFGGTSTVWVVTLVTFQTLLLAGYLYAHLAAKRFQEGRVMFHVLLLIVASGWVWYVGSYYQQILRVTSDQASPMVGTLVAVLLLTGIPYLLLSANATLIQTFSGGNYRLYAVGNAGSFCGLLAYPFLLEPYLPIPRQWQMFAIGIAVYTIMVIWMAFKRQRVSQLSNSVEKDTTVTQTKIDWKIWLGLGALSCFLLNSVTTHLSCDVTPMALLWTIVLAVYLLSWIMGFTDLGVKLFPGACLLALLLSGTAIWHLRFFGSSRWLWELGLGLAVILFGGWVVHGELYKRRPTSKCLSIYYLMISLGGAIGGLLTLLLPNVFGFVIEYPVALALVASLAIWILGESIRSFLSMKECTLIVRMSTSIIMALLIVWGCALARSDEGDILVSERNFYGMVRVMHRRVTQTDGNGFWANVLKNGGTDHGFQLAEAQWKSRIPTMYYGPQAGGLVFERHPKRRKRIPIRAACCGLGVGALATYAGQGDFVRFFEINPLVAQIALNTRYFTFVSGAEGTVDVVIDDARKALEKEHERAERKYDIISIDVFSGDAIPVQMITREAFELYLDRLEEDGIIALHISSWHLDLQPVVKAAAKKFDLCLEGFYCEGEAHTYFSSWVFLSRHPLDGFFDKSMHHKVDYSQVVDITLPEDDWHPLVHLLSFSGINH